MSEQQLDHVEEVPKNGIGQLVAALALAQTEFKPVTKDTVNPFFKSKYADLATIIAATQPALSKNGLVVLQIASVDEHAKQAGVRTILAHSSGQMIEAQLMLPAAQGTKFDAQTVGSAITYSRRYAMQSILGVSADADDDANAASGNTGSREQAKELGDKKVKEFEDKKKSVAVKGETPNLFYTWFNESQTARIEGDIDLMHRNRDLFEPLWSGAVKAVVANADQLEALKYELEQRKVPFKLLKSVGENLEGQLKESIDMLAKKKANGGAPSHQ